MQLDLPTMLAVDVTVTAILGSFLLLSWAREREIQLLGWWGLALLIQASGLAVMAATRSSGMILAFAASAIALGDGVKWKAAREFAHRPAPLFWILLGPLSFLAALRFGLLQSFDDRLNALCTIFAAYNFATALQFAVVKGDQSASRWPAVILLIVAGLGYLSWLPLNLAMPIHQSQWVATSIWFPTVMLASVLVRVALAFVVLSLAKERGAMQRRDEALTDALTGLPNRRALFEAADALGQDDPKFVAVSVLIFDLDHFKQTNDRFGHAFGDRVLKLFATTAKAHLNGTSMVARLGGEEFAAILPGADSEQAVNLGEAVRHAFAKSGAFVDGLAVGATVSVGAASDTAAVCDLNGLFRRADAALYAAKRAGRNRVELLADDVSLQFKPSVRGSGFAGPG